MLKHIFQQVLKHLLRTKLPEKRPKRRITNLKHEHWLRKILMPRGNWLSLPYRNARNGMETTLQRRTSPPWRLRMSPAMLMLLLCTLLAPAKAGAFGLNLDSIAAWGKFPRFCVNTYRWGDRFFNTYDSLYVQGTGKKFNLKVKVDSWSDLYNFRLDDGYKMEMLSNPSSTLGFHLTYMAVSAGYDMNIGKYFNGGERARKRFRFQFSCSLFTFEYYTISNDIGTSIKRMGYEGATHKVDIPFKGINTSSWGINLFYFFNHKKYSQAAAFNYSKLQMRSQGSFFAGLSFSGDRYNFDFWDLEPADRPNLPPAWSYYYMVKNRNYAFKLGYAYNWVFHRGWVVGFLEAPIVGLRKGYINDPTKERSSFGMSNQMRLSIIYNYKTKWFFGGIANWDMALIYDREHTLMANNLSFEASAGFRFNLW